MNSGTRAALSGGTTTIVDLVIPDKDQSLMDAVNAWKEDVEESGTNMICNFALSNNIEIELTKKTFFFLQHVVMWP